MSPCTFPLLPLTLLAATLLPPTARADIQTFATPWEATGAGPLDVPGTGWQVLSFDANDPGTGFSAGPDSGGLLMRRGSPWGLPGALAFLPSATSTRCLSTVIEVPAEGGDHGGRQTWLAAFAPLDSPRAPWLALTLDSAGTNGAAVGAGGPGEWSGQTLDAGLKLRGPAALFPPAALTVPAPAALGGRELRLSGDTIAPGHTYESLLGYDPADGRTALRVRDLTSDITLYEATFRLQPCAVPLMPLVGGFNGFAGWASDKAFSLRIAEVTLDPSFHPVGRFVAAPGLAPDDPAAGIVPRPLAPCLADFLGANNPPGKGLWDELGLGWGRADFAWPSLEPQPGAWRFADHDRMVLAAHRVGKQILPMLGYTPAWAVEDGRADWSVPASVEAWERYVETVVARYSRPPFNLTHFQVWNEPTIHSGFWKARSDDEFFEKVYLPAARIIRRYGCQVVFGGWPCGGGGLDHLIELLDRHEAWRWTDILDIHYYTLTDMVRLHDRYVATGKCRGVWQTEMGYHPFPEYLPNLYCRTLYFGLTRGWEFPDQYKLFWFAFWGAGPDAPLCLTGPGPDGSVLSAHGERLRVLNQLLGAGRLTALTDYATSPALPFSTDEETESSQAFRCGEHTIVALQVSPETLAAHPVVEVSLPLPAAPAAITRWSVTGERRDLTGEYREGRLTVQVPLADLPAGIARSWGREVRYAIAYLELIPPQP